MKNTSNLFIIFSVLFISCRESKNSKPSAEIKEGKSWSNEQLGLRAQQHLDSSQWDVSLFHQDIETYAAYADILKSYPLNKSPFPVAQYDYAVASRPFIFETEHNILKGVRIGEYENPESEKIIDKLTLLVLTNDKDAEESTLVESRNYPYLTAQGTFTVKNHEYDWVFSSSPDDYATLLLNMKLFDLRFGETVIIFPQKDESFTYIQIDDSPNQYDQFEDFKESVMNNSKVLAQMSSDHNIK
ncbi:hypothetical protein [Jiulongibacter sp. NS-SX5]|uniref:hypothetical protein n=1 Tax=Jiulongibacter sp. NS-SX5 TaxID=3463854 RepID=UPI0040596041